MKRFVQGDSRKQSFLLPEALDDYVTDTNPVRLVYFFVDELLQRGPTRPDDQLANVANALSGLDADEQALVVNFVQQFTDMLKAKHPARTPRRK